MAGKDDRKVIALEEGIGEIRRTEVDCAVRKVEIAEGVTIDVSRFLRGLERRIEASRERLKSKQ